MNTVEFKGAQCVNVDLELKVVPAPMPINTNVLFYGSSYLDFGQIAMPVFGASASEFITSTEIVLAASPDFLRSRQVEQEVLDILDAP